MRALQPEHRVIDSGPARLRQIAGTLMSIAFEYMLGEGRTTMRVGICSRLALEAAEVFAGSVFPLRPALRP